MLLETQSFEFGEFLLDAKEKVLLRDGKPLPITPKAFRLLLVLVENHGHLVEKDRLMKSVWADIFVEEGNLTFTIRLLRKSLGDTAQNPRFIETVSRRGYRFIGEVVKTSEAEFVKTSEVEVPENPETQAIAQKTDNNSAVTKNFQKFFVALAAVSVLLIGTLAIGSWYARSASHTATAPVLSAPFSSEKLSTNGKVHNAVVSPDGKNVVYTNEGSGGKASVWLRQLESTNNVEIIPPSEDFYGGLALSPDGNFLYFARIPNSVKRQLDIYRISIFGGVPQKIVSETQGWMSISLDGEKISFVRCYYREDENCSLWIANALDGKNERKLASRPRPLRIGDNRIAPDGKTVAFAVGQSENAANEFGLVEVDIESGAQRELTAQKFFNIKSLAWLPNQNGLLVTASRIPVKNYRIWQVSTATGDAEPLTKDSETYSALSLDTNASVLVSTHIKRDFRLHLLNTENSSAAPRVLADAASVAFAPNGKIVFSSAMSGSDEIWSINADGSEQRQLTNNAADEFMPVVSPDNSSIFFTSNRSNEAHVWRMNADGSNQVQITKTEGGYPLFVSTDGKWLYYHSGRQRTLWRVSTGGEEQLVLNKRKSRFAISPDGLQVAFLEKQDEENILAVISLADERIIKTFKFADGRANLLDLKWSQDGENLAYILADGEFKNNTLWFQPLAKETPQRIADLGDELIFEMSGFALSPDGKSFAVVQGGWKHDAVLLKGLR
jgi:DNA-binding winged helix-turn-helix (wHTH) protein/Tol biopolymer transport system component